MLCGVQITEGFIPAVCLMRGERRRRRTPRPKHATEAAAERRKIVTEIKYNYEKEQNLVATYDGSKRVAPENM